MHIESFAPSIQLRFNFTHNYLVGAATFTRLALEIDKKGKNATEAEILQHRSFVAGSIMQAVAALESEAWTLLNRGPAHHLTSEPKDEEAKKLLEIVSESIEKEPMLKRYDIILQLIRHKKLDFGKQPMQDTDLVIRLRNELTHFKSLWTIEMDSKKLFYELNKRDSTPPSFYLDLGMNFFPHVCLNYRRAKWAVDTIVAFIDYYYQELGKISPLDRQDRALLTV
jgi:hypothetical protein